MTKSATINSRIEPELKANAEAILAQIGLTTSEAITLFYKQIELNNGLPFEVRIPNAETLEAMEELEAGLGQTYPSFDAFLAEMDDLDD